VPDARASALLSNAERRALLQTERWWIAHDRAQAALARLDALFRNGPDQIRPPNILLAGPTNNGKSWIWGIHLTGVGDLPPRSVRRRSLQAGRMSAVSRRLWWNSLWALAHNEVLVTNWSMRDSKFQDPVEQHPSAT